MRRTWLWPLGMAATLLVILGAGQVVWAPDGGKGVVVLLTAEEAARPDVIGVPMTQPRVVCTDGRCRPMPNAFALIETRQATGPKIRVLEPSPDEEHKTPVRLAVDFLPREGTQVDIEGFKLEALKLIPINITDRVIQYVKKEGIRIDRADLPPGEHKLRITIKDTKEGVTQQVYLVRIVK